MNGFIFTLLFCGFGVALSDDYLYRPRKSCNGAPDGIFIRDPSSCARYFYCEGGLEHPGTCDNGMAFDSKTGQCEWAENVDCYEAVDNSKLHQPDCKNQPDYTFIDNPASCVAFYQCINGEAHPGVCPNDLRFNPKTWLCVHKEDYPECSDDSTPINQFAIAIEQTICKGIPDNLFVNDDTSCAGYFVCIDEIGKRGSCSKGLAFDPAQGICNYENLVNCTDLETKNEVRDPVCKDVKSGGFVANPDKCEAYYQCIDGTANAGVCPGEYYFNSITGRCDFPDNVVCKSKLCYNVNNGEFVEDRSTCAGYYKCEHGEGVFGVCENPFHFNPETQICDYPENVNCTKGH